MYVASIMQSHESRQHINCYYLSKMVRVFRINVQQFFCVWYFPSFRIGTFSIENVSQRNTMQQLTHYVIMLLYGVINIRFCLNESQHLNKIVISELYRRFPTSSLNYLFRQIGKHKFYCDRTCFTCFSVYTSPFIYLTCSTFSNRFHVRINLVEQSSSFFRFALQFYYCHNYYFVC